jgi:uncharacterized protein YycO
MIILLYRGTGLINSLIRWQTRSHYAHAAVMLDGVSVIESTPSKGVVARSGEARDLAADRFWVKAPFNAEEGRRFLFRQCQKKYDYAGVVRFVTREKAQDDDTWFCSELVYAAFQKAGIKLLNVDEAWKVSPALLAMSPYLRKL